MPTIKEIASILDVSEMLHRSEMGKLKLNPSPKI